MPPPKTFHLNKLEPLLLNFPDVETRDPCNLSTIPKISKLSTCWAGVQNEKRKQDDKNNLKGFCKLYTAFLQGETQGIFVLAVENCFIFIFILDCFDMVISKIIFKN